MRANAGKALTRITDRTLELDSASRDIGDELTRTKEEDDNQRDR